MPIDPVTAVTAPSPAGVLAAPDGKQKAATSASPAMQADRVSKADPSAKPIEDYREALSAMGAATWGAARSAATVAGEGALALDPLTSLATLGAGAALTATSSQPLSREQATAVGATERAMFGGEISDHVPSPYSNPNYIATLKTQSQLNAHPMPNPAAGHSPSVIHEGAAGPQTHTRYPGQRVDGGPNHTTHPAAVPRTVAESAHTTPLLGPREATLTAYPGAAVDGVKPSGTPIDRPVAADQITVKEGATNWATGAAVKPGDSGLIRVGVEGKSEIYLRPEDEERYRSGSRSAQSFPHLAVERSSSGKVGLMTPSEAKVTRQLVDEGNRVTRLSESRIPLERTHDFLVNGQRTELWTPTSVGARPELTIDNGIRAKCGQGGADHVIVDASQQPGLDGDAAKSAAQKALDKTSKSQLKDVRIIGDGFDFTADRLLIRDNGVK